MARSVSTLLKNYLSGNSSAGDWRAFKYDDDFMTEMYSTACYLRHQPYLACVTANSLAYCNRIVSKSRPAYSLIAPLGTALLCDYSGGRCDDIDFDDCLSSSFEYMKSRFPEVQIDDNAAFLAVLAAYHARATTNREATERTAIDFLVLNSPVRGSYATTYLHMLELSRNQSTSDGDNDRELLKIADRNRRDLLRIALLHLSNSNILQEALPRYDHLDLCAIIEISLYKKWRDVTIQAFKQFALRRPGLLKRMFGFLEYACRATTAYAILSRDPLLVQCAIDNLQKYGCDTPSYLSEIANVLLAGKHDWVAHVGIPAAQGMIKNHGILGIHEPAFWSVW